MNATSTRWADPNFVILPHSVKDERYPEDAPPSGSDHLPMQCCHLNRLRGWEDTKVKEYGIYFRVMCNGFLFSMQ